MNSRIITLRQVKTVLGEGMEEIHTYTSEFGLEVEARVSIRVADTVWYSSKPIPDFINYPELCELFRQTWAQVGAHLLKEIT